VPMLQSFDSLKHLQLVPNLALALSNLHVLVKILIFFTFGLKYKLA